MKYNMKIKYYKHLFQGFIYSIKSAFRYKPSIFDDLGGITIYGLETSISIRCHNCEKCRVALYWGSGEIQWMMPFPRLETEITCMFCGEKTSKADIIKEIQSYW